MKDFDLQLFADDVNNPTPTASQGGEDNVEPPKDKGEKDKQEPPKPKTFTENELEGELAKRLLLEKEKWTKSYKRDVEKEKERQERLSKLSEEERKKAEIEQKEAELAEREAAIQLKEQQNEAADVLNKRGIPLSFLSFLVVGTDNEKNLENITNFEKEFKKAVEAGVKEKLKGRAPSVGNGNGYLQNTLTKSRTQKTLDIIKKNQAKNR